MRKPFKDTGWVALAVSLTALVAVSVTTRGIYYPDADVFWTAAIMWIHGHAADAYSESALRTAFISITHASGSGRFGWFYAPHYYLLMLPLAVFKTQLPMLLWWFAATFIVFRHAINKVAGDVETRWLLVLCSGGFIAGTATVQNSMLFCGAALLAAFELFRDRDGRVTLRDDLLLAGLLTVLSMKPQLGLLFPFVMLAQGRYRAVALTVAGVAAALALSTAILGLDVLQQYLAHIGDATEFLKTDGHNSGYWSKSAAPYALVRSAGFGNAVALAVQGVAAAATIGVVLTALRCCPVRERIALLLVGGLLLSPYVMEYDGIAITAAVVLLWDTARGWHRGLLLFTLLTPALSPVAAIYLNAPTLPIADIGFLLAVVGGVFRGYTVIDVKSRGLLLCKN